MTLHDHLAKAREIAFQNRMFLTIERDSITDGTVVYVARDMILSGCIAQGATPSDAVLNLMSARTDYIASLIDDGLPIPNAMSLSKTVGCPTLTFEVNL